MCIPFARFTNISISVAALMCPFLFLCSHSQSSPSSYPHDDNKALSISFFQDVLVYPVLMQTCTHLLILTSVVGRRLSSLLNYGHHHCYCCCRCHHHCRCCCRYHCKLFRSRSTNAQPHHAPVTHTHSHSLSTINTRHATRDTQSTPPYKRTLSCLATGARSPGSRRHSVASTTTRDLSMSLSPGGPLNIDYLSMPRTPAWHPVSPGSSSMRSNWSELACLDRKDSIGSYYSDDGASV